MVVCSRDRSALLADALAAVKAALRPGDEVVVVDSASRTDGTRRVAEAVGCRVIRCDEPGASLARNAGASAVSAPLLAFTADDCRPAPDWLAALERTFEADGHLGFVTGAVPADREGSAGISVETSTSARSFAWGDDPASMGHGANLAVRRAAFEEVGGFDERLGAGGDFHACEDKDLCWRILRSGWSGAYEPAASVVHVQWRGRAEAVRTRYRYGIGDGAFAVKVRRLDGQPGGLLADRFWARGLRQAAVDLAAGYQLGAVTGVARAAGVAVGAARAWRAPLDDGRFSRSRRR